MSLGSILSGYSAFQAQLFPALEQDLGPLGERYQAFVRVVEFVRVERLLPSLQLRGRPQNDRAAVARAFIAKAVFDITTTRALVERLANDWTLRRLCGWNEATFSRAFSEFADSALPSGHLVGHVSRDSTAIEGREKPAPKPKPPTTSKRKRGRPRKGEQRPKKQPRRLRRRCLPTCQAPVSGHQAS